MPSRRNLFTNVTVAGNTFDQALTNTQHELRRQDEEEDRQARMHANALDNRGLLL